MVVFIDESGIHKDKDHSSFAFVYISVDEQEEIEREILRIEREHHIENFHWVDEPWKLRRAFLQEAVRLSFTAKVAIFRNPIHPAEALEWAAQHILVEGNFQTIFIDGKKPRWIERRLKKTLRNKGISVRKLKTVRHNSSPGVRLADAIAGLTRTYYDDPNGRAEEIWRFMKKKITAQLLGGQADR